MILYKIRFTNGVTKYRTFPTQEDADHFLDNEKKYIIESQKIRLELEVKE